MKRFSKILLTAVILFSLTFGTGCSATQVQRFKRGFDSFVAWYYRTFLQNQNQNRNNNQNQNQNNQQNQTNKGKTQSNTNPQNNNKNKKQG